MQIETMTIRDAVVELRELGFSTSDETLRDGIEQERFPFGICVKRKRGNVFYVFRKQFDEWVNKVATNTL